MKAGALVGGVVVALTLAGCFPVSTGKQIPNGATTTQPYGYSPTRNAPTTTEAQLPRPIDFQLNLIELSRDCFGQAGCNIRFRIEPAHVGGVSVENRSFTLLYEVDGGDDSKTGNIRVVSGRFHTEDGFISTPPGAHLTARVTQILSD
jgi:hypothetical protein